MATRRRRLPAVFSLGAVLALPSVSTAEESAGETPPIAVRVSEALHPGCPREPDSLARLQSHLPHVRRALPGEAAIELDVRTELRSGISLGTLTLIVAGAREERQASSQSCADVLSALSMMAAIIIGEEARSAAPVTPGVPVTPPSPPAIRARPAAPRPVPREEPPRLAWGMGAGTEINGNRGSVVLARWFVQASLAKPFDLTLRLGLARSPVERLVSSSGDVVVQWTELTFGACTALVRERRFRVGPCLDFEVGRLDSSVVDPPPVRSTSHLWLTAGASGKVGWQIVRPLSVELAAGLRAPVVRAELFFEPEKSVVYRAPVIVPFAFAGVVAHLP